MLAHGYLPVSRIMALDKGDLTLLALKSTVVPWRAARGKWCCIHCGQECTVMQIHSYDSMQVDTRFKMNRNTKRFINIQLHADQWKQGEQWNCGRLWRGWSPRGVRGEPMEPPRLIVLTQQHLVTILVIVALPTPWISLFKYVLCISSQFPRLSPSPPSSTLSYLTLSCCWPATPPKHLWSGFRPEIRPHNQLHPITSQNKPGFAQPNHYIIKSRLSITFGQHLSLAWFILKST